MKELNCWFDGCLEPINPGGHGAYGVVIKWGEETILAESGYIGHGPEFSNNVSEFSGVIRILEFLLTRVEHATIYGDSKLVVNLLNGRWKGKGGLYWPYFQRAKFLLKEVGGLERVTFRWIPREQNDECDVLSKKVLLEKGVTFRIQPQ